LGLYFLQARSIMLFCGSRIVGFDIKLQIQGFASLSRRMRAGTVFASWSRIPLSL
jgi:hypothetical protein